MWDITVQGAAFAAGLSVGFWKDYDSLIENRKINRFFEPSSSSQVAHESFQAWQDAVERTKQWRNS
jgi:glycerol kinase